MVAGTGRASVNKALDYDNNGNTTTDANGDTLVYDAWNRLVAVIAPPFVPPLRGGGDAMPAGGSGPHADASGSSGTTLATYTYDALGRRITQTDSSGNTTDLYYSDRGQVIEEQQAGQTTTQYVWSPFYVNQLVERDDQPDGSGNLTRRLYVEQDANYNVTSLTDSSGNVVERYVYDAYGNVMVEDAGGSYLNNGTGQDVGGLDLSAYGMQYLFQGGRIDPNTGLYHFGARDYDPATGRWEQQDPAGYINGANRYAADGDNPSTYLDPSGCSIATITDGDDNPLLDGSILSGGGGGGGEAAPEGGMQTTGGGGGGEAATAEPATPEPSSPGSGTSPANGTETASGSVAGQALGDGGDAQPTGGPDGSQDGAAAGDGDGDAESQQQGGDDDSDRDPDDGENQPDGKQSGPQCHDDDPNGQNHHAISKKVQDQANKNPNLKGKYPRNDPRWQTQAKDKDSHNGYQQWHRDLDDEIVDWLTENPTATQDQFENFLRNRYNQPDLQQRFPNGVGGN